LGEQTARTEIARRIAALQAGARPHWGKMTAHQMLCHLSDSYGVGLGEKYASPATGPLQRTLVKWLALSVPVQWMHNAPTRPEVKQGEGGTPPTEFERDRATLLRVVERFAAGGQLAGKAHPFFGAMTEREWLRWGYLHADHHLRQFGV
jgi:hypothetical protein